MAAPTTQYKPEYITKVDEYLKRNRDRTVKITKTSNSEKGYTTYDNILKVKLPTIVGFSIYLGVSEKTLYNWADENNDFREALDRIKIEQKQRLINMGLSGEYNATIAKLMLSHNHGMKERYDNTTDDQPINKFSDEQADRIADRINRRKANDGNPSGSEKSD